MLGVKKLLSNLKKNYKLILGMVVGGVIFGFIGVGASIVISSSSVTYSNSSSGLKSTALDAAITELNTKATTDVENARKECPSGNICTSTWAKLGDYVKMTPTSSSFTITTAMTGYGSNQSVNPSELNLWRVISINSDGTIDLVSNSTSSTYISFSGMTGYQNLVSSLNQIAAQYTNSKYTVATRHMWYSGQTGTITDTSSMVLTTAPWTTNSVESKGGGDTLYERDANLVRNALGTLIAQNQTYYWLASRSYGYFSSTNWVFYGRSISLSGSEGGGDLYYYNNGFYYKTYRHAIRPIITLKSGLAPTGSGTSSSPYVLG